MPGFEELSARRSGFLRCEPPLMDASSSSPCRKFPRKMPRRGPQTHPRSPQEAPRSPPGVTGRPPDLPGSPRRNLCLAKRGKTRP